MGLPYLYMVDNWGTLDQTGDGGFPTEWHEKNFTDAQERVKPFGGKAIFLRGKSVEMAHFVKDESLSWIYIDADHSYNGVWDDLTAWLPKVKKSGVVSGHDYLNKNYGVLHAVQNFCITYNYLPIHTIPEQSEENASFWFQKL
jgi:hypothetical protein